VKQYLVGSENPALAELLDSTKGKIEAARKPIALEGSSFRDPSLAVQARGLFGELEGTDVQQGSIHGPTPVQGERLRVLEARSQEALRGMEDAIRTSLEELNARLAALGPMRIVP
jgi:hypothetical protein